MTGAMELLAPAGTMRSLIAAVQSGADAVYFGASAFSARAGAGNFTDDEIKEAVRYCRTYGVKTHCAVNTLIKECELDAALLTVSAAYSAGVDAIIVQDLGLASLIREAMPDIELHASTQMTVTSPEGAEFLKERGFSRVVLARELSLDEIAEIASGVDIETEVFVHGAICMCYSGQCLMSSVLGGRSGNRGRCAQPCRLPYSLAAGGREYGGRYMLSPKDMALIEHLPELERAGVSSLKIEGRLKSPEYVSAVTGVYRKYLDAPARVDKADMAELTNAFSRSGFTDGYLTARMGADMMAYDDPANNALGIYTDAAKKRAAGEQSRRVPIHIFASLAVGGRLKLSAYDDDGHYAEAEGNEAAETARTAMRFDERLREQLAKLGQTPFTAVDITVDAEKDAIIPIKDVNAARRTLCERLLEMRTELSPRAVNAVKVCKPAQKSAAQLYLTAEAMTEQQAAALIKEGGIKRLYVPEPIADKLCGMGDGTEIVTKTADIFRTEGITTEKAAVSSAAALRYYGTRAAYGDMRLNVYNSRTAAELCGLKSITLSPELNMREIAECVENMSEMETEIIGYGRIPLMIMRNCPVKAMGACHRGVGDALLRDRMNMEFPIICSGAPGSCSAVLLNSKPIYTADMTEELRNLKINSIKLNFTVEKPEECVKILREYKSALSGEKLDAPANNTFTRGHLKRGVL